MAVENDVGAACIVASVKPNIGGNGGSWPIEQPEAEYADESIALMVNYAPKGGR